VSSNFRSKSVSKVAIFIRCVTCSACQYYSVNTKISLQAKMTGKRNRQHYMSTHLELTTQQVDHTNKVLTIQLANKQYINMVDTLQLNIIFY